MTDRAQSALGFMDAALLYPGGRPFARLTWQRDFVRDLYSGGGRREGLLWIPRKNGKTGLAALLGLHHLVLADDPEPSVILAARTTEQAGVLFDGVAALIGNETDGSPSLSSMVKVRRHYNEAVVRSGPKQGAVLKVISGRADTAHGLNPSMAIVDELHAHPNRDLWGALATAQGARKDPVLIGISTAGRDQDHWSRSLWDRATSGAPGVAGRVWEAPSGDPGDPDTWRDANPSMGSVLSEEVVRAEWDAAEAAGPEGIAEFEQLRLNRWVAPVSAWSVSAGWDRLAHEGCTWGALSGVTCYGGLDLGSVDDVTALVVAAADWPEEGRVGIVSMAWVAEANVARIGTPATVRAQADAGWLRVTPGAATDFARVAADIRELTEHTALRGVAIDALFEGHGMTQQLARRSVRSWPVRPIRTHMTSPIRDLEEWVADGTLAHDGSPVLAAHVANADKHVTDAGATLKKRKRAGKIDAAVAMVLAASQVVRADSAPVKIHGTFKFGGGM